MREKRLGSMKLRLLSSNIIYQTTTRTSHSALSIINSKLSVQIYFDRIFSIIKLDHKTRNLLLAICLKRCFDPARLVLSEVYNLLSFVKIFTHVRKSKIEASLNWKHVANLVHTLYFTNDLNLYYVPSFYGKENILELIGYTCAKLKGKFAKGSSGEIWHEYSQMLNPNTEASQKGIILIGLLMPCNSSVTNEEISLWLKPLMALWESRATSGVLGHVMFSLLSQVAKYHKDYDFTSFMPLIYKVIFLFVKGSLSIVENKLVECF